jgi:hypothetical protein
MKRLILCSAVAAFGLSLCSFKGDTLQIHKSTAGNLETTRVDSNPENVDALNSGTATKIIVKTLTLACFWDLKESEGQYENVEKVLAKY